MSSSSSSNAPPVGTPKASAPTGGKGKDFARMSSAAAAAAAAAAASTTPTAAAPAPPTIESTSPVKKGKDLSRMVANAPSSTTPLVASQDAPSSDVAPVGKPKGKDLSRMGAVQRSSPGSAGGQGVAVAVATAGTPVAPSSGLGKDLANMSRPPTLQPPPSQTNAPTTTTQVTSLAPSPGNPPSAVDIAEHQRRQNIARAAAGLPAQNDDSAKPPATGTDPNSLQEPSKDISPETQPTTRPSWSEATLSASSPHTNNATETTSKSSVTSTTTTTMAAATTKKYGDPSNAPILGIKLQDLCRSIDPSYVLDSQVQESLLEMADSFLDKVTSDAIRLARHRGSNTLDVVDVALALKKGYGMEVPGLGAPSNPRSGVGAGMVAGAKKNHLIGGWLFANKLNVSSDVEKGGRKKQKKV